jgi:phosphoribosylformylglycinamidine (FGAM) synthase-like amidotransferase family enzyme
MLSALKEMIPGADAWPRFERNRVEQFEARFSMVEVPASPSIFFTGMAGSRLPIVVSHGEGRAVFGSPERAGAGAGGDALYRPRRPAERGLSRQPERLAGRHHRR